MHNPEFTVKYVSSSYTVTTTNAYTGATENELVSNDSIVITITNQPFDYSGYQLYYNIRTKPHFEGNWTVVYPLMNLTSSYKGGYNFSYDQYIRHSRQQSNSSYTTITYSVRPTESYQASGYDVIGYFGIPYGSQLDFQVEAQVGHPSSIWVSDHPLYPMAGGGYESAIAYDTSSGWSNTKTIAIGETSVTEFALLIILALIIVITAIIVIIYRKKQSA